MTHTPAPADQLRAAAEKLRAAAFRGAMTATPAVADLLRAREPLADWLEQAAHHYECGIRAADDVFHNDPAGHDAFLTTGPGAPSPQALTVARAILGGGQP